jgi:hypothetical protein
MGVPSVDADTVTGEATVGDAIDELNCEVA